MRDPAGPLLMAVVKGKNLVQHLTIVCFLLRTSSKISYAAGKKGLNKIFNALLDAYLARPSERNTNGR